jgi:hypothetical protein
MLIAITLNLQHVGVDIWCGLNTEKTHHHRKASIRLHNNSLASIFVRGSVLDLRNHGQTVLLALIGQRQQNRCDLGVVKIFFSAQCKFPLLSAAASTRAAITRLLHAADWRTTNKVNAFQESTLLRSLVRI